MEEIEIKEQTEDIDKKIQELKDEKKRIQNEEKRRKMYEEKKLRMKSNSNGKSNILGRISVNFKDRLDYINKKRTENGFDSLSYPKITQLIIKHKKSWGLIEQDIIDYNTVLDTEEDKEEFNEK